MGIPVYSIFKNTITLVAVLNLAYLSHSGTDFQAVAVTQPHPARHTRKRPVKRSESCTGLGVVIATSYTSYSMLYIGYSICLMISGVHDVCRLLIWSLIHRCWKISNVTMRVDGHQNGLIPTEWEPPNHPTWGHLPKMLRSRSKVYINHPTDLGTVLQLSLKPQRSTPNLANLETTRVYPIQEHQFELWSSALLLVLRGQDQSKVFAGLALSSRRSYPRPSLDLGLEALG